MRQTAVTFLKNEIVQKKKKEFGNWGGWTDHFACAVQEKERVIELGLWLELRTNRQGRQVEGLDSDIEGEW